MRECDIQLWLVAMVAMLVMVVMVVMLVMVVMVAMVQVHKVEFDRGTNARDLQEQLAVVAGYNRSTFASRFSEPFLKPGFDSRAL